MKPSYARLFSFIGLTFFFSCKQKIDYPTSTSSKSLLWEISGKGLGSPSYFLGTMHLMCAEDAVLSNTVKSIIRNSGQVYLEVEMDNVGELLSGIISLNMKDDKTLADLLPLEDYEKIKLFYAHHQPSVPFAILEKQQPMMISAGLYELFLNCEHKNGIDLKIIEEAARLKKETRGLETIAFQSSIFDSIPYEAQALELVKTLDSIDRYKQAMTEMINVYKSQDIEKLHELTTQEEAGVNNYLDILLYNRNKNWVEQVEKIAKEKMTLFAVGAGHLGGKAGVINLLKEKGFQVRPLVN